MTGFRGHRRIDDLAVQDALTALARVIFFVAVTAALASAADPDREKLNARFDKDIVRLTEEIAKAAKSVDLYSQRGDAYFYRGKFAEAVADYEKMVELQPALETSHWRKGIAYFYAERFNDAARQFEIYHSFDNVDRENGIWRYLSQTKAVGRAKARNVSPKAI